MGENCVPGLGMFRHPKFLALCGNFCFQMKTRISIAFPLGEIALL